MPSDYFVRRSFVERRPGSILRLHFAKAIRIIAWRKPLLTKLQGYDGASGAKEGPV